MNKELQQLIENRVSNSDLYGRSFTYGVAFEQLVIAGAFNVNPTPETQAITEALAESLADELSADYDRVIDKLTLNDLVAVSDIALIDDLVRLHIFGEVEA